MCLQLSGIHTCSVMVNQITQVLQERNTKDAERIQYLECQLPQMEQQLENLTDKLKKKTVSEVIHTCLLTQRQMSSIHNLCGYN